MSSHFLSKSARNTSAGMQSLRWSSVGANTLPRTVRDEPAATLTLWSACQGGADLLGIGILKVGLDGDVSAELLE